MYTSVPNSLCNKYKDRRAELTNYVTREIDRTKPNVAILKPWSQILSTLTRVKATYEVVLKSTQGWVCPIPCSIKCIF
jgi:hypothetical protein